MLCAADSRCRARLSVSGAQFPEVRRHCGRAADFPDSHGVEIQSDLRALRSGDRTSCPDRAADQRAHFDCALRRVGDL